MLFRASAITTKMFIVVLSSILILSCGWNTNIISSVRNGNLEKTKYFLSLGKDIDRKDINGFSLLMIASYWGHTDIVRHLCEEGANLNIRSNEGSTALIYAAQYGYGDIVNTLLDYGANHKIVNHEGRDALFYAKRRGNQLIIERLENLDK